MSARTPDQAVGVVEAVGQHVAVRPGADRQHLGHQAGPLQLVDDHRSGAVFEVADLGMGVDVAADGDQAVLKIRDESLDGGPSRLLPCTRPHCTQSVTRRSGVEGGRVQS